MYLTFFLLELILVKEFPNVQDFCLPFDMFPRYFKSPVVIVKDLEGHDLRGSPYFKYESCCRCQHNGRQLKTL